VKKYKCPSARIPEKIQVSKRKNSRKNTSVQAQEFVKNYKCPSQLKTSLGNERNVKNKPVAKTERRILPPMAFQHHPNGPLIRGDQNKAGRPTVGSDGATG
jgi:hypothetical protein